MSCRLVIATLMLSGLALTAADGALAASALSDTSSAATAQYGGPNPQQESLGDTIGSGSGDDQGALGDTVASGSADEAVQAPRQVESAGDAKLPFTGYAAITILLMGLGLLTAGVVVRRAAPRIPLA